MKGFLFSGSLRHGCGGGQALVARATTDSRRRASTLLPQLSGMYVHDEQGPAASSCSAGHPSGGFTTHPSARTKQESPTARKRGARRVISWRGREVRRRRRQGSHLQVGRPLSRRPPCRRSLLQYAACQARSQGRKRGQPRCWRACARCPSPRMRLLRRCQCYMARHRGHRAD